MVGAFDGVGSGESSSNVVPFDDGPILRFKRSGVKRNLDGSFL